MHQISRTEQAILDAAESEFIEKGYSGSRTVSIAQSAGVTHAMFHYYFRTKEQLFERVLRSKLALLIDSIFETLDMTDNDATVTERIEAFVVKHYQSIGDNSSLPLFVLNEVVHNPERIDLLKEMLTEKLKSIDLNFGKKYGQAINAGEITSIDVLTLITDVLILNLSSIVMRPLLQQLTHKTKEEYDAWRLEENLTIIRRRIQA